MKECDNKDWTSGRVSARASVWEITDISDWKSVWVANGCLNVWISLYSSWINVWETECVKNVRKKKYWNKCMGACWYKRMIGCGSVSVSERMSYYKINEGKGD